MDEKVANEEPQKHSKFILKPASLDYLRSIHVKSTF